MDETIDHVSETSSEASEDTGPGAASCAVDTGTDLETGPGAAGDAGTGLGTGFGTGLGAAGDAGTDVQGGTVAACAQSVFLRAAAGLGAGTTAPDPAGFGLSGKKLRAQGICWPSEQPVRQPGPEATWRVFAADQQLHADTVREDLVLGKRKGADDFPVFCRKVQHPFEITTDEHGNPVLDARSRPIAKRGWFVWARSVYRLARLHDNLAHSPQAHARLLTGNDIRFPWQTDGCFYMRKGAGAS